MNIKNTKKYRSEYLSKLADLGCIICKKMGFPNSPAEIHHIRYKDLGMSRRSKARECIPLCPNHHRNGSESYHYSPKKFNAKWGSQKELLQEVLTYVNNTDDVK